MTEPANVIVPIVNEPDPPVNAASDGGRRHFCSKPSGMVGDEGAVRLPPVEGPQVVPMQHWALRRRQRVEG